MRLLWRPIMSRLRPLSSAAPPKPGLGLVNEAAGDNKHLRVTADHTREPVLSSATVTQVWSASPSVRSLTLAVHDPNFSFKAGQWIDLFIPGLDTVAGFSIYSPPAQLIQNGTIDLGVKESNWPPAAWVHSKCAVGSSVTLRAGGDFHYSQGPTDKPCDLLLVGGGVGVNPLASMLFHTHSLHAEKCSPGKVMLLYSAKTYEELLYKDRLDSAAAGIPGAEIWYFTTRRPPPQLSLATYGHITQETLEEAVSSMDRSHLKAFLCGPPPMIEAVNQHLLSCGLSQEQILYEKWW